jgi:hypothetical protein
MIGVPWSELAEANRDKDRDVVRLLPEILAEFGLEVVRYDESRAGSANGLAEHSGVAT